LPLGAVVVVRSIAGTCGGLRRSEDRHRRRQGSHLPFGRLQLHLARVRFGVIGANGDESTDSGAEQGTSGGGDLPVETWHERFLSSCPENTGPGVRDVGSTTSMMRRRDGKAMK